VKKKYLLLLLSSLIISVVSLSLSIVVLLNNNNEINPSKVKTVEIPNTGYVDVNVDSSFYRFSLVHFIEGASRFEIKIDVGSGYKIEVVDLGKSYIVYDLRVTIKEAKSNSLIVWIEKIEG